MNRKNQRKIKLLFFIILIIQCLIGFYIIYSAEKKDMENKKEISKISDITSDKNYAIYLKKQKISFASLKGSMVLYNNVTMKLENGKLKTIASFGISSIGKKEKTRLLNIIKNIEKAKLSDEKIPIENKNNLIVVSGSDFYIDILKKGKCYIYKIMNNQKTVSEYFEYCQKGAKNGK